MMKRKTSLSLSEEALRLRDTLAQEMGISGAAVVEMALRELAKGRGKPQGTITGVLELSQDMDYVSLTALPKPVPAIEYHHADADEMAPIPPEPAPLEPSVAAFVQHLGRPLPPAQPRVFRPQPKVAPKAKGQRKNGGDE